MTEQQQQRTHELFSEPADVRMHLVERLIESVMDEEVDARTEEAWNEEVHKAREEAWQPDEWSAWSEERSDQIYKQVLEREIRTRRFRVRRSIRLDVARELIDSLDELNDAGRKALRAMCTEALFRHFCRTRFTLG